MDSRRKQYWWINSEVDPLLQQYRELFDISKEDRTISLKQGVSKHEADQMYVEIHKLHERMSQCAWPYSKGWTEEGIRVSLSRMYEAMMFSWDDSKKSYSYFYQVAKSSHMDTLVGRIDRMTSTYRWTRQNIARVYFSAEDIPKGQTAEYYAKELVCEHEITEKWKLSEKDGQYIIQYTRRTHICDDIDPSTLGRAAHTDRGSIWHIADLIDWQVLSEYLPDVACDDVSKHLAYVMCETIRDLYTNRPEAIRYDRMVWIWMGEMMSSRTPLVLNRARVKAARNVLRQAYAYYAEDYSETPDDNTSWL